jgi:hypothetical protein
VRRSATQGGTSADLPAGRRLRWSQALLYVVAAVLIVAGGIRLLMPWWHRPA